MYIYIYIYISINIIDTQISIAPSPEIAHSVVKLQPTIGFSTLVRLTSRATLIALVCWSHKAAFRYSLPVLKIYSARYI